MKIFKDNTKERRKDRNIYNYLPLPFQSLDKDGNILRVNKLWLKTLGYSEKDVIGKKFSKFLTLKSKNYFKTSFPKLKKLGKTSDIFFEMSKKNGAIIDAEFNGVVNYDEKGRFRYTACVFNDITEKRKLGEKMKEMENRYLSMLEHSLGIVYIHDFKGNLIDANDAALNLFGYKKGEIVGLNYMDLIIEKRQRTEAINNVKNIMNGGKDMPSEFKLRKKDGSIIWIETQSSLLYKNGKPYAIQGIARDTTERRESEDRVKESEEKLLEAQKISGMASWEFYPESGRIWGSEEAFKIYDIVQNNPFLSLKQVEACNHDSNMAKKALIDLIKKGKPYDIEFTITRAGDKKVRYLHSVAKRIYHNGALVKISGIIHDITDKKKKEEKLLSSNQMLENITHGLPGGLLLLSKDLKIVWANKASLDETGLNRNEIFGKYCYEATHGLKSNCKEPNHICPISKLLKTDKSNAELHIHHDKKGNKLFVEVSVMPIKNEDGEIVQYLHITKDVTEEKMLQDKIVNSEEKHRALYESSHDAIMTLIPPSWKFLSGNLATIKMFGVRDEKHLISLNLENLSPKMQPNGKSSKEESKKNIMKAMTDGSNFFRWTHKTIKGKEFPATILLTKVKIGEQELLQATVRDTSEEEKAVIEAERFNKFAVNRELKMVELKNEINGLLTKLGQSAKYKIK